MISRCRTSGVKKKVRAINIAIHGIKHPITGLFQIALRQPPYTIKLASGKEIEVKSGRAEVMNEIMKEQLSVDGNKHFVYRHQRINYSIAGYNSPETMFSTFIFEDWSWLNVKGKIVVDIGGYIGDTAIYFISRGALKVISIEPFPWSCKLAIENIRINNLSDRVEIINAVVGQKDSFVTIDPNYENSNVSTVIASDAGVKVPIVELATIVEKYGIKNGSLKVNCEGCEYELFENSTIDTIRSFSDIQIHYHNSPTLLVRRLNGAGFLVRCGEYVYAKRK